MPKKKTPPTQAVWIQTAIRPSEPVPVPSYFGCMRSLGREICLETLNTDDVRATE